MRRIIGGVSPSDWIVPISRNTQRDFEEVASSHRDNRVCVIPNAVDRDVFRPLGDPGRADGVRRAHGIPTGPFFLTISSLAPHKNVRFLLDLWPEVRRKHPDATLVVAGGKTTDRAALESEFGTGAGVHFTGYVSDDALAVMLSRCEAFLFPSLYEGFGLPILEAMACGAPVIASDRTAIPEVVGEAATLLDPTEPGEWVAAIAAAISTGPRKSVHEPSIHRASLFDWGAVAAGYVALYRRALQS
ncbi:MAG TPA: glycosyltransferase family 1 protein, partial [Opitutaceae bacterium]